MPYKDLAAQRAYQRDWMRRRRAMYMHDKRCGFCNADENLELHHLDPSQKEHHNIWSWSSERRKAEIAKCIVLCRDCHQRWHQENVASHCGRGHELTSENTYVKPSTGRRECRECRALRRAA